MRYVFFGTPEFAAIVLEKLIAAGMVPIAVVTNPDRPVGRKQVLTPSAVKTRIRNYELGIREKIKIFQPEQLSIIRSSLFEIQPALGILAAYGKIIPKEIIDIFPKGIIVVHPSLLPKYRGATPIQSAILAGEKETGTTLIVMDEKVDHGNIISNFQFPISNDDTYNTLAEKLAVASADLLIKTLPEYLSGEIVPQPQDHAKATYSRKFASEDGYVDLKKNSPEEIWRKVRALNPEPGVWTIAESGKRMKILAADVVGEKLVLRKVQFDGEKPRAF